jgi:hypothetical protein
MPDREYITYERSVPTSRSGPSPCVALPRATASPTSPYQEQWWRWEDEERQREEAKREEAFDAEVARWRRAEDIRDYVRAALAALEEQDPPPVDRQAERDRLRWALEYADRIDPLL